MKSIRTPCARERTATEASGEGRVPQSARLQKPPANAVCPRVHAISPTHPGCRCTYPARPRRDAAFSRGSASCGERVRPRAHAISPTYPEPGRLCFHETAAFPMAQPSPADAAHATSCRVGSDGYSPFGRGKESAVSVFIDLTKGLW